MIAEYFDDGEVREEFCLEFISLWDGWLGPEHYHKLDEVTPSQWQRFHHLIALLFAKYDLYAVDLENYSAEKLTQLDNFLPSYEQDLNRGASEFTMLIIPSLHALLVQTWDYTYILYHQNNGAVEALSPFVGQSQLFHFSD